MRMICDVSGATPKCGFCYPPGTAPESTFLCTPAACPFCCQPGQQLFENGLTEQVCPAYTSATGSTFCDTDSEANGLDAINSCFTGTCTGTIVIPGLTFNTGTTALTVHHKYCTWRDEKWLIPSVHHVCRVICTMCPNNGCMHQNVYYAMAVAWSRRVLYVHFTHIYFAILCLHQ